MALRKRSPAAGEFLFEIDSEPLQEQVTALGRHPAVGAGGAFAGRARECATPPTGEAPEQTVGFGTLLLC
jgi:hypothetical protein